MRTSQSMSEKDCVARILVTGARDFDLVAAGAQEFPEGQADCLLVVDDQDSGHVFSR